jgi:hypothetical protein
LEDFNHYALLLDIDGNAWSDRYRLYTHMNTPVLKQASNLTGFFEHVMAPGAVLEQYAPDLSDLPTRARQLLREMQQQPGRLLRMAGEGGVQPWLNNCVPRFVTDTGSVSAAALGKCLCLLWLRCAPL